MKVASIMFTSPNVRIALWAVFVLTLFWNYQNWQLDYAPPPVPAASAAAGGATPATSLDDAVPALTAAQPAGSAVNSAPSIPLPVAAPAAATAAMTPNQDAAAVTAAGKVHVVTDVFDLEISLRGGELTRVDLPEYALEKGSKTPMRLLNRDSAASTFVLQTGLAAGDGAAAPTHLADFSSAVNEVKLADGQDEIKLPFTWTNGAGVTVTKTYTFHRGRYQIDLDYQVRNAGATPWSYASYARLLRNNEPIVTSYFKPDTYSFKGPAYYDGTKYQKLKIDKADTKLDSQVKGGWIAGMQHHFIAVVVPNKDASYQYKLNVLGQEYKLTATGVTQTVNAGAQAQQTETLYIGPKLQRQMDVAGPKLHLVTDYGWLAPVSQLLFGLLSWIHAFVGNWGVTIMLATLVLKLIFYPLSEASGRSMAKMKQLQPRLKNLQETYKDQRDKLGQAMMELYKKEKVNPAAGCLPMLVQIPVFIAFYWVLLESVEMRQAPFVGWIQDLSSRDPWFILPLIMAGASYIQYKLNPQMGADPLQAKIMGLMPVAMSVMFAFFPAGLVLYWVTNTVLSIAQQWNINRRIAAAAAKARR
jgi:YidC/Oxa1 family membrane protein insertase